MQEPILCEQPFFSHLKTQDAGQWNEKKKGLNF